MAVALAPRDKARLTILVRRRGRGWLSGQKALEGIQRAILCHKLVKRIKGLKKSTSFPVRESTPSYGRMCTASYMAVKVKRADSEQNVADHPLILDGSSRMIG